MYRQRREKKEERRFVDWVKATPQKGLTRKMNGHGQKGWPDQLVVKPGANGVLWFEFKDKDGEKSIIQDIIFGWLASAGQDVHVVYTCEEAQAIYRSHR